MQKSMYITIQLPFSVCGLTSTHLTLTFAFDLNINFFNSVAPSFRKGSNKMYFIFKMFGLKQPPIRSGKFLVKPFPE